MKAGPIFRGYTQSELDAQYNARAAAPDFDQIVQRWARDSDRARKMSGVTRDISYGRSEDEKLDVFHAEDTPAPIQIFFHGGYWRSQDKSVFSFLAPTFVQAGITLVVPNYGLCPKVSMDQLVDQCLAAIAWVHTHAKELGGDPDRIYISGHSAGGHIVGMALATDWPALGYSNIAIRGACAVSGLFDLEAIRLSFLNSDLRLTPSQATRNSPALIVRKNPVPLLLSVGALESDEFHRQTNEYARAWRQAGSHCETIAAPGRHHYTVLDAFVDPDHPLGRAVISQVRRQ